MSDSNKFLSGDGGETTKGGGGFSVNNVSEPSKHYDGGKIFSGVTRLALGSGDTLIEPRDLIPQDNTIPLSPQWLIAKSGDNKPPPLSMDPPRTPGSHGGNSDFAVKERWRGDGNRDTEKRRDWWRTNAESDNSRRDGWREEERESAPTMRRDRWKESGDGGNDNRRVERWPDNLISARDARDTRDATDGRRAPPSDRWSESLNREATTDTVRRNSKWSTRWGPEDKDKEIRREKRTENEKESEAGHHSVLGRERTMSTSTNRGDNDREPDASARDRVWRPHSLASRNKAEGSLLGSTPPKYAPGFGVGRGRGENTSVGFAVGRGRASASAPRMVCGSRSSIGASSIADKCDMSHSYRYPRAKLLDIYRSSSTVSSFSKIPENFTEAPEVTQLEPVEPLAFIEPESDERDVLEGIGKGDIVGSGAVYASKEKSRDFSRAEKDDICNEVSKEDNKRLPEVEDSVACKHVISDDLVGLNEVLQERTEIDRKQTPAALVSQGEDPGPNEGKNIQQPPDIFAISDGRAEFLDKYIAKDAPAVEKLLHEEEKEMLEKKHTSPAQEEISLYYIDPQGAIQGPFLGADIIGWFELGYFDTNLPVRIADAPEDSQFCPLGEIMPQLQPKPQTPWEYQVSDKHLESNDSITERNIAQSSMTDSDEQRGGNQQVFDGSLDNTSNFQLLNSQAHDNMRADKVLELQPTNHDINSENPLLERSSSIRRRMSAFPDIEAETGELPKQSLFSQQWPAGAEIPQVTQASSGYSPRVQTPQSAFWQSGTHGLSSERHDSMQMEGSSLLHGLDEGKMRQLLQIEKLQAQKQLDHSGAPSPRPVQQQPSLLELLNQQKSTVTPSFEQLRNPPVSLDFNANALQQLASAHPLQQIPSPHPLQQFASSHSLSRIHHPSNLPIPPSDVNMEELLRLHQQQQASHPLLEQLLRQQMQFPSAEQIQLPNRASHLLHDNSRLEQMHAYQLEQLHHRQQQDALIEFLQRQQEEKIRAHQQAAFLQQQQLKLDEQRVSGVWEIDEFGQFVRTQASIPMQSSHEALQQQQLHLMQQKANLHQAHHSHPQHLPVDVPGLYTGDLPPMQHPKVDMRTLRDIHAEPDIAALLGGTSRMDTDPLAFLQGHRSRFDGQAPLANPGMMPFEMDILQKSQMFHPSNIDTADVIGGRAHVGQGGLPTPGMMPFELELLQKNKAYHMSNIESHDRIRGGRPHDLDLEAMHMYAVPGRDAPRNNQHYNLQIPLNHNVGPINGHAMESLDFPESVLHQNNLVNTIRKQHQQQQQQQHGRPPTQAMSEDLLRLLAGNGTSEDSSVLNSMFSGKEQHQMPNLNVNQQLDTLGYIGNQSVQSAWDSSLMNNSQHDETTEQKLNSSIAASMDSTVELSEKWTPAAPATEDSAQLQSFDQSSFEVDQTDTTITVSAPAADNLTDLPKNEDASGQSSDASALVGDDNEFVETKKNKKRGSKSKPVKNVAVPTQESLTALQSPGKSAEVVTDENNCVNLSSPSLGDFLPIKEEKSNPQPSPVWSVDLSKQIKVAKSLKEIQEAEKKARDEEERQQHSAGSQLQAPSPKLSTPISITNTQSAWQKPLLSSQLTNKPTANNKLKNGGEDEMFWDYSDKGSNKQLPEENTMAKRLASLSVKNNENVPRQAATGSPSLSGFSAALAKPPPVKVVNKHVEVPATVSQQASLSIGEAKAFRRWCEDQIRKFNGKGHMSLLEFCMGLPSATEVGDYLSMYLGEGPMVDAFKTEFLRRKETIPPEIIRVIFPTSEAVVKDGFENFSSDKRADASSKKNPEEDESEFEVVRSAKRKGKKGKKVVDPSLVLGFNVSSGNRIFMGEIQHIE